MAKSFEPFSWWELKPAPIIGVDEVGRGCLAGPVYAAAVVLDESKPWRHYTDSKTLSAHRREILSEEIKSLHRVALGFATVEEIDRMNILRAALLAMKRAIDALGVSEGHVLVDGNLKIPGVQLPQTTLIKGDLRAQPVGAASIVAKVARDNLLKDLSVRYPDYGFEKHKGYSTLEHKEAIRMFGPSEHHRRTFAGVKEFIP